MKLQLITASVLLVSLVSLFAPGTTPHETSASVPPNQWNTPTPTPQTLTTPAVDQHVPFDPLKRPATLPDYPHNKQSTARPQTKASLSKPAGIDLDVTYIGRTPLYNKYDVCYDNEGMPSLCPGTEDDKRWPSNGELVTFTAHIVNKGTLNSGAFAFKWYIDGSEVASGTYSSLAPGAEGTETYKWSWAHSLSGERLSGSHTVRFTADPANAIAETYESNNTLEDRTDALALKLAVAPALYSALETPVDPKWPFSAEDWLQKQIAAMNAAFARSVFASTPNGIVERVRLDEIVVSADPPPTDWNEDGGFYMSADDRYGNAYYDPGTDVSGGLLHELNHQLGIIDLYNIGLPLEAPQVIDHNGRLLQMETGLAYGGLMVNPGVQPPIYDEHTANALNSNKGYRRGYYGEYLYDVAPQTYLRVLDNTGDPAAGVTVKLYQRASGPLQFGSLHGTVDDSPEITGVTDASGLVLLTNRSVGAPLTTHTGHTLHDNPFGVINVVGINDEFIVELTQGAHQEHTWLEITGVNLATWSDGGASATLTINSHVPPPNALPPPTLSGVQENGLVKLQWSPVSGAANYNVYQSAVWSFTYRRIETGTTSLNLAVPYNYAARDVNYAVTAVDAQGHESGFSDIWYAFRLYNPASIAVDAQNNRLVLDPQNGYSMYQQLPNGRFADTRGSFDVHLEFSRYLTRDAQGHLIISHPGDYYTSRHSIRVLDEEGNLLLEFGQTGSGPGEFNNPAGVSAWGQSCSIVGPLTVDSHTLLLLHFDGSYDGAQSETGTPQGTSFTEGQYAQGVVIDSNDTLTYPSADNLNRDQGAIEFWIRPQWNGNDNTDHTLFEVGNTWFNRMRIMKDGANNLRFILWDSTTEYGTAYNIGDWVAGEWHHIAVTWQATNIALYVDGKQRANSAAAHPADSLAPQLNVGSSYNGNQQADATIDELRISDKPRVGNSDSCTYRILAVDSGNNRIQAFDEAGRWIGAFGDSGSGPGQFDNPQGLAVSPDGRVTIADSGNNRLQILNFDGTSFSFVESVTANFNQPSGVAAYGSNRILVADTGNNKVKVLDASGSLLAEYGAPNDGRTGTFNHPRGVVGDEAGNIAVADTGNQRVVGIVGALASLPGPFAKSDPPNGAGARPTDLTLIWESSASATKYEYCYSTINNGTCEGGWKGSGTNTSANLTALSNGTTYYWQVRASNSAGTSDADNGTWWSFTTVAAMSGDDIDSPIPVNATPYSTNQDTAKATTASDDPKFDCFAEKGSASVWFQYSPTTNGTLKAITTGSNYDTILAVWAGSRGSLSSVACNDNNGTAKTSSLRASLIAGTKYYVEVAGHSAGGTLKMALSFTPKAPAAVTLLSPVKGTQSTDASQVLDWTDSAGATNYQVQVRKGSATGALVDSAKPNDSTYTTKVLPAAVYYWRAGACNKIGCGWSGWWTFKILLPVRPTLQTPANGGPAPGITVPLDWSDSPGATYYQVQVRIDTTYGSKVVDQKPTISALTTPALLSGHSYFWRVRACSPAGCSAWTTWWKFKVP